MHVPADSSVIVLPETVQTPVVVEDTVTGSKELAVNTLVRLTEPVLSNALLRVRYEICWGPTLTAKL